MSAAADNPHIERWNRRYSARELIWSIEANRTVQAELADLSPGKALDLGCGEGRNALWLAEQGWQVTAVDFSSVALAKARRIADHRGLTVEWVEADLSRYVPAGDTYDLVLICFLHTDSGERSHWLPSAAEAVRRGGTFLYLGHDRDNPTRGHGGPQDPDNLPSLDELRGYLTQFEIEVATTIERNTHHETGHGKPDEHALALDTLVKARSIAD